MYNDRTPLGESEENKYDCDILAYEANDSLPYVFYLEKDSPTEVPPDDEEILLADSSEMDTPFNIDLDNLDWFLLADENVDTLTRIIRVHFGLTGNLEWFFEQEEIDRSEYLKKIYALVEKKLEDQDLIDKVNNCLVYQLNIIEEEYKLRRAASTYTSFKFYLDNYDESWDPIIKPWNIELFFRYVFEQTGVENVDKLKVYLNQGILEDYLQGKIMDLDHISEIISTIEDIISSSK